MKGVLLFLLKLNFHLTDCDYYHDSFLYLIWYLLFPVSLECSFHSSRGKLKYFQ